MQGRIRHQHTDCIAGSEASSSVTHVFVYRSLAPPPPPPPPGRKEGSLLLNAAMSEPPLYWYRMDCPSGFSLSLALEQALRRRKHWRPVKSPATRFHLLLGDQQCSASGGCFPHQFTVGVGVALRTDTWVGGWVFCHCRYYFWPALTG